MLRREFCPACGERVALTMDDVVGVSQNAAAERLGEEFNQSLRTWILVVVVLLAAVKAVSYLYDTRLIFDGSGMPSPVANAPAGVGSLGRKPLGVFEEPRPLPIVPLSNPKMLGHRLEPVRTTLRGANLGTSRAYDNTFVLGLQFLAKGQELDGGWPVAMVPKGWPLDDTRSFQWGRVGVSSLCMLAFMGNGHVWSRDSKPPTDRYNLMLQQGVRFLMSSQDLETGRFGVGEGDSVHFMYNHGMATLAIAEAAALSGDVELLQRTQKAVDFAVKTQTAGGGWNYFGHKEVEDISVSAWMVQALIAAREAGAKVPEESIARALGLFRRATVKDRVAYRLPNDDGIYTPSLAGMGLMIRQLCGENVNPELKALAAKVLKAAPVVKIPEYTRGYRPNPKNEAARAAFDPYMLYYCTYGLFFSGGPEWQSWNTNVCKSIIEMQDFDGAWHTNDINSYKGGTYYSTALCLLTLEVHHRIHHSTVLAERKTGE